MKNQKSKIYHFVLVMTLFIFVSKAKGEYSVYLIGESFTWQQDEDVSGRGKNQGILYGIGALGKWDL